MDQFQFFFMPSSPCLPNLPNLAPASINVFFFYCCVLKVGEPTSLTPVFKSLRLKDNDSEKKEMIEKVIEMDN